MPYAAAWFEGMDAQFYCQIYGHEYIFRLVRLSHHARPLRQRKHQFLFRCLARIVPLAALVSVFYALLLEGRFDTFLATNFYILNYWHAAIVPSVSPLWSLGVEMHFYAFRFNESLSRIRQVPWGPKPVSQLGLPSHGTCRAYQGL